MLLILSDPELVARINTRHHGLTKSVKTLTPTSAPAAATFPLPIPAGTAIPTAHLSTKDAQNMAKIQAEWVRIEALQDEKIKLAERLERIVGRARERAKTEWKRVGGVDMDEIEADVKLGDLGSADVLLPSGGLGSGSHKRRNKPAPLAQSMSSGSLSAMAQSHSPAPSGHMPPPPAPRSGSMGRSRKARDHSASDMDVEVEMETADAEVEPDDALYCFCQQKSYGEMIGCDNDKCQYEWVGRAVAVLTAVPCQVCQHQWPAAGYVVLSGLCA